MPRKIVEKRRGICYNNRNAPEKRGFSPIKMKDTTL